MPASATPSLVTNKLVTVEKKDGRVTALPAEAQNYYNPRLSPDGRRLAVQLSNITGVGLSLYDLERGGGLTPVVTQGENGSQVWYPKGERLAFYRLLNGRIGLASRSLDTAEVVEITPGPIFPTSVDADGRVLAVRDSGTQGTVRVTEDRGTARIESLMETESHERAAELSPDGRWLAYESKLRPTDSWENYQISCGRTRRWGARSACLSRTATALRGIRRRGRPASWSSSTRRRARRRSTG